MSRRQLNLQLQNQLKDAGTTEPPTEPTPSVPPTIESDLLDYNPASWLRLQALVGVAIQLLSSRSLTLCQPFTTTPTRCRFKQMARSETVSICQPPSLIYFVTARGAQTGRIATTTFTDANPSADIDQCANDPSPSPSTDGCNTNASEWVNGNLGASKSVYYEGDSIPYRIKFDNLSLASHTVTIEWDTTKSDKHALDYLTTFNQSVANANPCLGITGCGSPTTFPIPADPQVTGAGVTPIAGNFTLYGGTITAVSAYSYPNGTGFSGDMTARITITFTASQSNPVLAWGGHISTRADWGADNSAVAISGSPYHTALMNLDGSGGNQDRSLSADAVIFFGSIKIIKDAIPNGSTSFPFTASPSPLSNFSLVDDGTSANTKIFSNITNFQTYMVTETPIPANWTLTEVVCSVTSPNGGSQTVSGAQTTIVLNEGENVTCTYTDKQAHLIVIKHVINDNGGTSVAADFTMTINGVTAVGGNSFAEVESPGTDKTLSTLGSYNVTELGPSGYSTTLSADCTGTIALGETKTCTVTNNDIPPQLHLRKVVVNDNGGTKTVADFTLTANGTGTNDLTGTSPVDSGPTLKADTWALSEFSVSGYSASAWTCVGGSQSGSNITVDIGGSATCTITNDDVAIPQLTITKAATERATARSEM